MSTIFTGEENPEDNYIETPKFKNVITRSKTFDLEKNFQNLKINTQSLIEETQEEKENKNTTKFAEATPINYKLVKQISNDNINIKKHNYYDNESLNLNDSNNPFLFTVSSQSDLSTPPSKNNNLTTPKNHFEKIKKSKKRKFTPCFSSKRLNFNNNNFFKSDVKLPSESLLKLFEKSYNKNNSNLNKNIFLELIEESSNELNLNFDNENNVFNVLDSNCIISTLFNDNKENPEKQNLLGQKIEKEINSIIDKINNKKLEENDFNIYIINKDCSVKEMNKTEILNSLNKIVCFEKESIIGDGKIYAPSEFSFIINNKLEEREGRIIFKLINQNNIEGNLYNNVNINSVNNIKLISIEIHCF